ncbi:MAG TPA: YceI family protein [Rhizomicrobium sp.]|nr:YceI family protein [Rhizomicrobium sp.]
MKILFALAVAMLLPAHAYAAHWKVDYAKSRLGFTAQWSKEPFNAAFKSWKADIDFDPGDLAHARADVTIALASEESDEKDFDEGLKGAIGFAAAQFPIAHFVTTGFDRKSPNDFVAAGKLTIKGVTREVTLPFTLTIEGNVAHMRGTAAVIRTDYGIGEGEWAQPTPVAHEVTVTIDITATRA